MEIIKDTLPLILSTNQAAKYLAGKPIGGKCAANPRAFLMFAAQHKLKPLVTTTFERGRGGQYIQRAKWSRLKIDAILNK